MGTSIKRSVGIRVACAIAAILIFSGMTTMNILRIEGTQDDSVRASSMLDQIQRAEVAHYKWAANLSNALYAGTEFTGSMDHTGCVLGQWLYSELNLTDSQIESLRTQIEPLHKELHASAGTALGLYANSRTTAQQYYQETIQNNLTTLVGLLDKVVDRGTALSTEYTATMNGTIAFMHLSTVICLVLALIGITSLVVYFLQCVVKPLVQITHRAQPLQEGRLSLDLGYRSKNELGQLAQTLESSMGRVQEYVADIDRVMAELAQGNFDVSTSARYIGDFQPIEEALGRFTVSISDAMSSIIQAEQRVSSHAEQLSSGAQALAQGATEQASAVQELYATVDDLSKSAGRNVEAAANAQRSAKLTSEQVTLSIKQMEEMVAAKSDEAAKATKDLIENSVQSTERGSRIVGEVSQSLKQALDLVVQSDEAIHSITEAVHQEAESLSQVSEGIGQISSVVQTNSASSEESAAVSSELFEQVHLLEDETKKFRLKGGAQTAGVF